MSGESDYQAVNVFRRIKEDAGCDDLVAAILTLAQHIPNSINVYLGESEDYSLDRVGKDIAEAIESVTKDGSIQVSLDGELINSVRGMVDVNTDSNIGIKPKSKSRRAKKK